VFHLSVPLSTESHFGGLVALALDASWVVYHSFLERQPDAPPVGACVTTRWLDRNETRAIEGTEGATLAALSPDGRWLAFLVARNLTESEMTLKKVALKNGRQAGPPTTICERLTGWPSVGWGSDEEIVLAMGIPEPRILVVPAEGGEPRVVLRESTEQDRRTRGWWQPRPLPDGRAVLVTRFEYGATLQQDVEAVDLATGERTLVLEKAAGAEYVATGHVLALRDRSIVAAPFDLSRRKAAGGTVAVLAGVADFGLGLAFVTSRTGVLASVPRPPGEAQRRLAWIDAQGRAAPLDVPARPYAWPAVSRDGQRVTYQLFDPSDVHLLPGFWVSDLDRRTTIPLQGLGMSNVIWNPDGERVTCGGGIGANRSEIWERRADGTDEPQRLYAASEPHATVVPLAWTTDGTVLAFAPIEAVSDRFDLWMLRRGEGGAECVAKRYLSTKAVRPDVVFSPDGKRICYTSNESGSEELHVQRFPGPGAGAEDARAGRWQISTNGGKSPWWSADGAEIRYLDREKRLMSVQVETGPRFSVSAPALHSSLVDLKIWGGPTWTADGRLMAVLEAEGGEITRIDLVLNWLDELEAKVPVSSR
jgi:Tol biopolymer transport system component